MVGKKKIPLYVSATSWVAPARGGTPAPLSGMPPAPDDADWGALGKALREQFGAVQVQLLLSARQCRFLVLPWISSCYSGASIRAYVADAFAEAMAVTRQTHHVEIDWPAYGEPILAAAYPRALIESLRATLRSAGHVLESVDSSIGPILRRYGRALGAGPVLLAYAEDDGITGITIEDGRVVQVETLSGDGGGLDDLGVWSSRKQFSFADDRQLRWLATTAKPDAFAGVPLAIVGAAPVSAGHAMVIPS